MKLNPKRLEEACYLWNYLTRPYILKDDLEHKRDNRFARRVLKVLKNYRSLIGERSNGSLYVK